MEKWGPHSYMPIILKLDWYEFYMQISAATFPRKLVPWVGVWFCALGIFIDYIFESDPHRLDLQTIKSPD